MAGDGATPASVSDLVGWRMRALGLGDEPGADAAAGDPQLRIAAAVERLLALQGQDWIASRWALGVRTPGTVDADVLAAFNSGALVRSWPMRGTIHVVAAEDIGWMQALTNHRVLPGAPKRRQFLGLDDASLARMTDIAVDRLTGGNSLSREELGAAWTEAGIGDPEKGLGQWRYHVIWWLCQNGITVPGPVGEGSGEPRLVLADEWITAPRTLDGDEALAELARRFALGRGPVQEKDLAWWTGLTVRDARRGVAAASDAGQLTAIDVEGVRYWSDPALLDTAAPVLDATLLLPGFDEHLLGYTDRSAVLDAEHFERIVPGRNGMFRATVVERGRVVGVWTRTPRAKQTKITVEAFPGAHIDLARLQAPAEAWGAFTGVPVEVVAG